MPDPTQGGTATTNEPTIKGSRRAIDDPVKLARAARIFRNALARQRVADVMNQST